MAQLNFIGLFILISIFSTVSVAGIDTIPLTIKCALSPEAATWKIVDGEPNVQLMLTTLGIDARVSAPGVQPEVRELVKRRWRIEFDLMHTGDRVAVSAKCIPSSEEVNAPIYRMFPEIQVPEAGGPTLVCPKGDSLAVIFLTPNDPDPRRYIYNGLVTVLEDEPEHSTKDTNAIMAHGSAQQAQETGVTQANQQGNILAAGMSRMTVNSGGTPAGAIGRKLDDIDSIMPITISDVTLPGMLSEKFLEFNVFGDHGLSDSMFDKIKMSSPQPVTAY